MADVAAVRVSSLTRYGGVTADAQGEVVTGLVLLRRGANSRAVTEGVKREFQQLAPTLPAGVEIIPFYDRADLVEEAVATVETALGEAVVLVLIVLVALLGNLRAALTMALILPLPVLATFGLMYALDVSANLSRPGYARHRRRSPARAAKTPAKTQRGCCHAPGCADRLGHHRAYPRWTSPLRVHVH